MQQDCVFLRMGLIDYTSKDQFSAKTVELPVSGWHGFDAPIDLSQNRAQGLFEINAQTSHGPPPMDCAARWLVEFT
jgi:hypothetical protein